MAERTISVRLQAVTSGFTREWDSATASVKTMKTELGQVGKLAGQQSRGFQELGTIGLAMGTGVAAGAAMAVKAAVSYESAFAGVRKTVNATEARFAVLSDGIRDMALEMPASAAEIAGVAEAAGQLGVRQDAILGFTRTMVDLGETTNLSANEAATALARVMNIMGTSSADVSRLGSTIVELGNNSATTESEIVELGTRLAAAGAIAGLSEADVLAFASTLTSVGVEAEAGGTALSKVFTSIRDSVIDGSGNLEVFARTAGVTVDDFSRMFREDAAGAIALFVDGLGRVSDSGASTTAIFKELELTDQRLMRALLSTAGAGDLLTQQLDLASGAWSENSALTDEAAQRYETTAAQMEILRNRVVEVAISFGEQMLPALNFTVDALGDLVDGAGSVLNVLGPVGPALAGLAAAVGVAGGGFLLLAPRIAATQAALATLRTTMPGTIGALGMLGKAAAGAGAGLLAIQAGNMALDALAGKAPDVDLVTKSLLDFADTSKVTGQLAEITGDNFEDLGEKIRISGNSPWSPFDGASGRSVEKANKQIDSLDKSLASLVARDPAEAERLFDAIASAAEDQGVSLEMVKDRFNDYQGALAAAEVTERTATAQTGELTEATDELGMSVEDAEQALDEFKDMLDAVLGQAFSVTQAEDALTSSIYALEDQVRAAKEAGDGWTPTLEGNSRAAVANRDAVMDMVAASADLVQAHVDQGASSQEVQAVLQQEKDRLNDVLTQLGFNIDEVGVYTGVLDRIPTDVGTQINVTGADRAQGLIDGIAGAIKRLQGSGIDVAVNAVGALGVRPFADGGMLPGDARIQPPGTLVQWAEPETGGEAFIPMGQAKRGRSTSILADVAAHFGFGLVPLARGGVINVTFGQSLANAGANMANVGGLRGSTTGLDPEFLRRFRAYSAEVGPLSIISGFRSYAQQAALYAKYLNGTGNLAAPPGRSKHERGLAIDHGPRSTPAMRSAARKYRLHYPVPGEPWHVEPFANGGIRGRLAPTVRMASGGVVSGAIRDTRFAGALMGTGYARARENPGYTAEEVEEVAKAWYDLAVNVDETTADMILGQGLLASEITDASRRIIEGHEAEQRAAEEAAEAQRRAVEEDYRRRVEINNNTYALGLMSTEDHLSNLDRRMAREEKYTDEWMALYRQREQVVEDDYQRRVEMNNNAYELGRVSTADHLGNLERRMARETELTDEWMALYRQREQVLKGITDAEQEAADALDRRVSDFESWSDVTQRVSVGWGSTAAALARNITDQVEMFTDWATELEGLTNRGLSQEVIDMLGLGEGPQALGQLRTLAGASDQDLAALNAAAGNRSDVFRDRAIAEGNVLAAPSTVVNFQAKVMIGTREITDLVRIELRDGQTNRLLAGSR